MDNKYIRLIYSFSFKYIAVRNMNIFANFIGNVLKINICSIELVDSFMFRINNNLLVCFNFSENFLLDIDKEYCADKIYVFSNSKCDKRVFIISDIINKIKYEVIILGYQIDSNNYYEIFMKGLLSNSYSELYNYMRKILSSDELDNLIKSIIGMVSNSNILHEWGMVEINKLLIERKNRKICE